METIETTKRIESLEMKISWQENIITELNQQVAGLQTAVDRMESRMGVLQRKLQDLIMQSGAEGHQLPENERPPHY